MTVSRTKRPEGALRGLLDIALSESLMSTGRAPAGDQRGIKNDRDWIAFSPVSRIGNLAKSLGKLGSGI